MENNNKILDAKKAEHLHYILTYHCDESTPWEDILRTSYATGKYSCVAGQLERGKKDGKVHIQGYLGLKKKTRGSTVLKDFPSGAWFKAPNRWQTDRANTGHRMHAYATKEDTRISLQSLTLGEPPQYVDNASNGKKGRDEQLKRYASALTLAKEGEWDILQIEHPDLYLRYHTTLKRIHNEDKVVERTDFPFPLRPWQELVLKLIQSPDARTIHWFYDQPGNSGKSTFLKWLAQRAESFYLDGGKKQDNMFLLKQHHTLLLCDLPRHGREFVPYSTMETFKNGIWLSTKYEGNRVHRTLPGAVVVCANFLPDVTKLSMDRWDIYNINKNFNCDDIKATDLLPLDNNY